MDREIRGKPSRVETRGETRLERLGRHATIRISPRIAAQWTCTARGGSPPGACQNQVSMSFWCALTPAPRCVRLTRAPHASAELVRPPLAHARPPVASREPQRLPVPHIRPPGAHHLRCSATTMSQSPFPSIVSRLHTPLPPPLRVPQAESDKTEARIWWLSFIAGCIIVLPFC